MRLQAALAATAEAQLLRPPLTPTPPPPPRPQEVIVSERRFKYEEEVRASPLNYDTWFDYIRLEESAGDIERTREVGMGGAATRAGCYVSRPRWLARLHASRAPCATCQLTGQTPPLPVLHAGV